MNILLIEPDKILAHSLCSSFKRAGHVVAWERTAQTALDALDTQMPDVIVLEIQLGLHNGIEFLYEIRSYTEWQHIPVIIHSINQHVLGKLFDEPLKQLGVQAILYKPRISTKELLQAVAQTVPA